jgi:hypothetical protein
MRKVRYISGLAMALCGVMMAPIQAQDLRIVHFSGVFNDYTPSTVSGGPYEMHGEWTVDVQPGGIASFSADMTMETSDYGITSATAVDPTNPGTRSPHTHHISVTNATVSYDLSVCPANSPATTGTGLVVSGGATTTGNGSPATFEAKGASTIQICINGGSQVSYSNMTLVYTGPATGHFGPQAIHGVVRKVGTK